MQPLREHSRLEYRSAAGEVFTVCYSPNPVGSGVFASVSAVGKNWARVSGPWATIDQARMAVELATAVAEEFTGIRTSEVRDDVAKLQQLKASGAKFLSTLDKDRWAIIWFKPPKGLLTDTGLRYDARAQAEEAMRLAQ